MAIAHFEEILKRRSQEINDHNVVVTLSARPHNPWYACASHKGFVNLGFLSKRTVVVFCIGRLKLDSNLLSRDCVDPEKNCAYGGVSCVWHVHEPTRRLEEY